MKDNLTLSMAGLALGALLLFGGCKKDEDDPPSEAVGLYFTYWDDNSINKVDLINTPNAVTTLFDDTDGIYSPSSITLTDDGYLIACLEEANQIIKMQKNGSGTVLVLYDATDGVSEPTAITVDNSSGTIYWCNSGTDQVMKGSDDGLTSPATLYGGGSVIGYAYGIGIDKKNNKLYTSDFNQMIEVGNLDGSGTTTVLYDNTNFPAMESPSNLYVDAEHGKIYWSDESADQVVEANLDGTGTPVILFDNTDGVQRADGVYVDYVAKKIYWSETTANVIARGNLDGTGEREVLINGVESYGLVLEFR